ncbi:MAG: hypothetical protein V7746_11525 [Halioglobus sp.]
MPTFDQVKTLGQRRIITPITNVAGTVAVHGRTKSEPSMECPGIKKATALLR